MKLCHGVAFVIDFAWSFGRTRCNFFSNIMFSLSIDFILLFVCFFTFGNPFYLEIRSPNLTTSLELFPYSFHSFSILNIVIMDKEGVNSCCFFLM